MFTGIIRETAIFKGISRKKAIYRLGLLSKRQPDSFKEGDSLSINGVCLTLVGVEKNGLLSFDIMEETYKNTTFSHLEYNDTVNVERALKLQSRLDGHFVLGHIDRVGKIRSIVRHERPYFDVAIAPCDKIYVVKKGSIAIDGISLTIGEVYEDGIRLYIIPYTLENTNLKYKKSGDPVNIEFDILGKYAQHIALREKDAQPLVTEEFLKNKGFIVIPK